MTTPRDERIAEIRETYFRNDHSEEAIAIRFLCDALAKRDDQHAEHLRLVEAVKECEYCNCSDWGCGPLPKGHRGHIDECEALSKALSACEKLNAETHDGTEHAKEKQDG